MFNAFMAQNEANYPEYVKNIFLLNGRLLIMIKYFKKYWKVFVVHEVVFLDTVKRYITFFLEIIVQYLYYACYIYQPFTHVHKFLKRSLLSVKPPLYND